MKIGIIGSGNVGSALGKIWAEKGHEVMFSSRHPEKSKALAQSVGNNASSGLPVEAVKFGDVVAPGSALDPGRECSEVGRFS